MAKRYQREKGKIVKRKASKKEKKEQRRGENFQKGRGQSVERTKDVLGERGARGPRKKGRGRRVPHKRLANRNELRSPPSGLVGWRADPTPRQDGVS